MNDHARYDRLREASWRRPLTESEQAEVRAYWQAHPGAQEDWEADAQLSAWLRRLPDVPVASNFTARVVAAAAREGEPRLRIRWPWFRVGWWPGLGVAGAVLLLALAGYRWHQATLRTEVLGSLAVVAAVKDLPSPDLLADFEAIRRLGEAPAADEELLTLLQ